MNRDCEKCNHTGLIPFKNKAGKVIPNAFLHCDCHPIYGLNPEPEHYQPVRPEDFDFSMSYSYYRSLCQYHGWADPGSDIMPEPQPKAPHSIFELDIESKKAIQQIKAQVLYNDKQIKELRVKKKVSKDRYNKFEEESVNSVNP